MNCLHVFILRKMFILMETILDFHKLARAQKTILRHLEMQQTMQKTNMLYENICIRRRTVFADNVPIVDVRVVVMVATY